MQLHPNQNLPETLNEHLNEPFSPLKFKNKSSILVGHRVHHHSFRHVIKLRKHSDHPLKYAASNWTEWKLFSSVSQDCLKMRRKKKSFLKKKSSQKRASLFLHRHPLFSWLISFKFDSIHSQQIFHYAMTKEKILWLTQSKWFLCVIFSVYIQHIKSKYTRERNFFSTQLSQRRELDGGEKWMEWIS